MFSQLGTIRGSGCSQPFSRVVFPIHSRVLHAPYVRIHRRSRLSTIILFKVNAPLTVKVDWKILPSLVKPNRVRSFCKVIKNSPHALIQMGIAALMMMVKF